MTSHVIQSLKVTLLNYGLETIKFPLTCKCNKMTHWKSKKQIDNLSISSSNGGQSRWVNPYSNKVVNIIFTNTALDSLGYSTRS